MGTAKSYEKETERSLGALTDLAADDTHPSILMSWTKPGRRRPPINPAEAELGKQRMARKVAARAAQNEKSAEVADAALKLTNARFLKQVRLLESVIKRQAAEIACLKKR